MRNRDAIQRGARAKYVGALLFILLLPLILPLALIGLTLFVLNRIVIYALVWLLWVPQGTNVLVIYSDSPIWHDYFVDEVVPLLANRCRILNWSERKKWSWWSLSTRVFRSFSGARGFNPMVLVFRPFRKVQQFRFFYAFKEQKKGDSWAVEKMKRNLMDGLGLPTGSNPR